MTKYYHTLTNTQHSLTCASRAPLKHPSTVAQVLWQSQDLAWALIPNLVFFLLNHKGTLIVGPSPSTSLQGLGIHL